MLYGKKIIGTIGIMSGIPYLPTEFTRFLVDLTKYNNEFVCQPNQEIKYVWSTISYHVAARNNLVLNAEGDWLLMLDCDQIADPDILMRMLNSMKDIDCEILTAAYYFKNPPHVPVLYYWDEELKGLKSIAKMPKNPFKVDGCGGGCLLVNRSVYARIQKELGESPFDIRLPYSEDLSFAIRCRDLEIEMWANPRIESRHLKVFGIKTEDYDRSVAELEAINGLQETTSIMME